MAFLSVLLNLSLQWRLMNHTGHPAQNVLSWNSCVAECSAERSGRESGQETAGGVRGVNISHCASSHSQSDPHSTDPLGHGTTSPHQSSLNGPWPYWHQATALLLFFSPPPLCRTQCMHLSVNSAAIVLHCFPREYEAILSTSQSFADLQTKKDE